ncbi:MAG TPA: molybdopterin dinucleotide binding domain-containing protein, partial [Ktedonobacteraceae bacterium]|nr:molybdopterin dinucleotide binding domain-containing protein [Ktedonobacteraceae bacterium]
NAEDSSYNTDSWQYKVKSKVAAQAASGNDGQHGALGSHHNEQQIAPDAQEGRSLLGQVHPSDIERDPTLQDPRCIFQVLKRHYSRYTPEMVQKVCGISPELFLEIANALTKNSGRERTAAICYALGWTQHTVGVQMIRTSAILQLLLGNMGRPGGGILALRGHANIQGSTDIATLYNLYPGYLAAPSSLRKEFDYKTYMQHNEQLTGWWHNYPKYFVSLLKAWFGDAATPENDFGFNFLPKITGDHSQLPTFVEMMDGKVKGFFAMGQNPAAGAPNSRFHREALAKLDWLVVRDLFETETASFWDRDGVDPSTIGTEVFFVPGAGHVEKEGSFTNTQRLLQFHELAVEAPDDARSENWFLTELYLRMKEFYKDSTKERDLPIQKLTWNYRREGKNQEPVVDDIVREINGYTVADNKLIKSFQELKSDGSTAAGCWILSGIMPEEGRNLSRNRKTDDWVSLDWGYTWPANRHILYNRASADPEGRPWSERKKYIWWDGEHDNGDGTKGRWTGYDIPDFPVTKDPATPARPDGVGVDAHSGADPFMMITDGRAWLYVPRGLTDGPLPTHYEPVESPVSNLMYAQHPANPVVKYWPRKGNRMQGSQNPEYPYAITTYRVTEHHVSGAMSRWLPWLSELQPELFAEISPELAAEKGIKNGDWITVYNARAEVEAKALVTTRIQPLKINDRVVHQIGFPYQWSYKGVVTGDTVNDLVSLVAERNVSMHEAKSFTCNLRPGRRNRAEANSEAGSNQGEERGK